MSLQWPPLVLGFYSGKLLAGETLCRTAIGCIAATYLPGLFSSAFTLPRPLWWSFLGPYHHPNQYRPDTMHHPQIALAFSSSQLVLHSRSSWNTLLYDRPSSTFSHLSASYESSSPNLPCQQRTSNIQSGRRRTTRPPNHSKTKPALASSLGRPAPCRTCHTVGSTGWSSYKHWSSFCGSLFGCTDSCKLSHFPWPARCPLL